MCSWWFSNIRKCRKWACMKNHKRNSGVGCLYLPVLQFENNCNQNPYFLKKVLWSDEKTSKHSLTLVHWNAHIYAKSISISLAPSQKNEIEKKPLITSFHCIMFPQPGHVTTTCELIRPALFSKIGQHNDTILYDVFYIMPLRISIMIIQTFSN